jgi:hypothetical protein
MNNAHFSNWFPVITTCCSQLRKAFIILALLLIAYVAMGEAAASNHMARQGGAGVID